LLKVSNLGGRDFEIELGGASQQLKMDSSCLISILLWTSFVWACSFSRKGVDVGGLENILKKSKLEFFFDQ
jgi:hypothetical protein